MVSTVVSAFFHFFSAQIRLINVKKRNNNVSFWNAKKNWQGTLPLP